MSFSAREAERVGTIFVNGPPASRTPLTPSPSVSFSAREAERAGIIFVNGPPASRAPLTVLLRGLMEAVGACVRRWRRTPRQ